MSDAPVNWWLCWKCNLNLRHTLPHLNHISLCIYVYSTYICKIWYILAVCSRAIRVEPSQTDSMSLTCCWPPLLRLPALCKFPHCQLHILICQSVQILPSVCLSVHQACSPVCLSLSARSCHIFACCLTTHLARANKVCLIDSHLMIFISHDNTFTYPPYACILLVSILYVCKP